MRGNEEWQIESVIKNHGIDLMATNDQTIWSIQSKPVFSNKFTVYAQSS